MKFYKHSLLGFLFVCQSASAWAEAAQSLNLEDALQAAVTRNPQLKAARAQLNVSQAAIRTASARLNPVFSSDNGIAEGTSRVGIEQTIELGGKRKNRIALAMAQRDAVFSLYNTRFLDIRSDVRRVYTQLYNAQEKQLTYENILQVTQELVNIAKMRQKAGDIATLDVLQTEIVNVNAQNDLQTIVQDVVLNRNRLNALLRQPLHTNTVLTAPSTVPQLMPSPNTLPSNTNPTVLKAAINQWDGDSESLIQLAYQRRPELQQINRNLVVTQREMAVAKGNRIPNLALTAGPDIVYKNLNNSANQTSVFFTGTLEIPLFNRQQGPIQEALAKGVQLQEEAEALKTTISLEVSNALYSYGMNLKRVQRYEQILLPYSTTVVQKSKRAFQEGKSSILTPINAQQAYINTRIGYLQALQDTQNSISDLERAIGAGL